jgi:uncharacterized protein YkwD
VIDQKVKFTIKFGSISLAFLLLLLPGCSSEILNPLVGSTPSDAEVEMASFDLINEDRAKQGLPALKFDSKVAAVARAHSTDMRDRNFYAHVNPDGRNFSDRLRTAGVSFRVAGENLAVMTNNLDPANSANSEFLKHSTHRANLLDRRFTRVGIGVARSGNKYWITQDFVGS